MKSVNNIECRFKLIYLNKMPSQIQKQWNLSISSNVLFPKLDLFAFARFYGTKKCPKINFMGISIWCDFYTFRILRMDWIKLGSCMQIWEENIYFETKAKPKTTMRYDVNLVYCLWLKGIFINNLFILCQPRVLLSFSHLFRVVEM